MRTILVLSMAVGCDPGGGVVEGDPTNPGEDPGSDPNDPPIETPTTPVPTACAVSPTLTLTVAVVDGRLPNDRQLDVTTTEAATVAASCTANDDPTDAHLVESTTAATAHSLRFQGLSTETAYTCRVAPTCPTMATGPVEIAVQTEPGPDFPVLSVDVDPVLGMTGSWTLVSYMSGACRYGYRWLLLYDAEGVARWWYQMPDDLWIDVEALYDPADNTVTWGGGDATSGRARIVDLWAGDLYVTAFEGWQELVYSHDAKRMPDGQLLTLDYRETTDGDLRWLGFGVRVHDPVTEEVTYDLASQRYFDEGWLRASRNEGWDSDPYHANWLEWEADPVAGDRLYLSLCSDWSLMSFDIGTGDVRWKLGSDLGWTVLDAAGAEIGEGELPRCTHGNQVLGPDHLLVYDNGQSRSESRIEEWRIDAATSTATREWMWTEPGWHESTLGDVDVLAGDRLLVTEAHPECWADIEGDHSDIVEVDRLTGAVASRMTFPETEDTIYRAERYDGCTLLSSVRACPELADRAAALGL